MEPFLSAQETLYVLTVFTEYASFIGDSEKSYDHKFPSCTRLSGTYITEDGASISELSEERILCCWECVIVRL